MPLSLFCRYIKGELVGGLDIVQELQDSGELVGMVRRP
jgi:glutaredoxin-related protein